MTLFSEQVADLKERSWQAYLNIPGVQPMDRDLFVDGWMRGASESAAFIIEILKMEGGGRDTEDTIARMFGLGTGRHR